jgi:chemotaxis protein CheD
MKTLYPGINGATKENKNHFLFPSTLFASKEPVEIQTLLGSCIAVCLYDPVLKCGGMNHYMLPLWNGEGLESPKYGNIAIDMLLEKMGQLNAQRKNMIAKVFGGASQFDSDNAVLNVGERNIQVAETMLARHHIRTIAASTGGKQGRKIVFNSETGQVMMKYIVKQ